MVVGDLPCYVERIGIFTFIRIRMVMLMLELLLMIILCVEWTGFYGDPIKGSRVHSWNLMRRLSILYDGPWLMCGDLNEITLDCEKVGGNPKNFGCMEAFRDTISDCDLRDIEFSGPSFTWDNKQKEKRNVKERLDRALANDECFSIFNHIHVHNIACGVSDHLPIIVELGQKYGGRFWKKRKRRFFFEHLWTTRDDCGTVIENAWNGSRPSLPDKLKSCASHLSDWNKTVFGHIPSKIKLVNVQLEHVFSLPISDENDARKVSLTCELDKLQEENELIWKQRSRINWLKFGDKNSSFFHESAKQRGRRNNIGGIFDESGVWKNDEEGIALAFVNYFNNLFTSSLPEECDEVLNVPFCFQHLE